MAFCRKCGVYLADGTKVCPSCGAAVPGAGNASASGGAAAAQAEAPRQETRDKREPWERDAGDKREPWEREQRARDREQGRDASRKGHSQDRDSRRGGTWNPGQEQSQGQGWTGPGAWRYTGREDAQWGSQGYTPPYMDSQEADARNNRGVAALSYFGVLFFLPLVLRPKSPFCRFHANQGLLLLILWGASQVCFGIGFFGWLAGLALSLLGLVGFFIGIAAALGGKTRELPLIGSFRLIK